MQRETDGVTPLADAPACYRLLLSRQAARRLSARAWMRLAGEPFGRWADWPSTHAAPSAPLFFGTDPRSIQLSSPPLNHNRSACLPQTFGTSCAQLTLFARHRPVQEFRPMIMCFVPGKTAVCIGFGWWSARVAQPSAAFVEKEFCEQARRSRPGFGTEVLPRVSQAKRCRVQVQE